MKSTISIQVLKELYQIYLSVKSSAPQSTDEFLQRLENHDIRFSEKTLRRRLEDLRNKFHIDIHYDQSKKRYTCEVDEIDDKSFEQLITLASQAEMIDTLEKSPREYLEYIHFGDQVVFKGAHHLTRILNAIIDHREIEFDYRSHYQKEFKKRIVKPYLLKEYLGRWYVHGMDHTVEALRTFGLDRIEQLHITERVFTENKSDEVKKNFDDIIGLIYDSGYEKQQVILKVEKNQAKYLRTLPLHHTQAETGSYPNGAIQFTYHLIPNLEFEQKILMNGDRVEVMEPLKLRKKIKHVAQKISEKYLNKE